MVSSVATCDLSNLSLSWYPGNLIRRQFPASQSHQGVGAVQMKVFQIFLSRGTNGNSPKRKRKLSVWHELINFFGSFWTFLPVCPSWAVRHNEMPHLVWACTLLCTLVMLRACCTQCQCQKVLDSRKILCSSIHGNKEVLVWRLGWPSSSLEK